MKLKEYKVLGHKVEYSVPENSKEFNELDPKRPDAACEEAVANIVYRSMNPDTRSWFLHGRDEEDNKKYIEQGYLKAPLEIIVGVEEITGIARKTKDVLGKDKKVRVKADGAPITTYDEPQEQYYNRVCSQLVKDGKFASEDLARNSFQDLIAQCASQVPFDITEREKAERGPKKLAIKYKQAAAKTLTVGAVQRVNENQLSKINKVFEPTGDTSVLFNGVFLDATGKEVPFSVSDKDAETLGWLIKEFFDWKNANEMITLAD